MRVEVLRDAVKSPYYFEHRKMSVWNSSSNTKRCGAERFARAMGR